MCGVGDCLLLLLLLLLVTRQRHHALLATRSIHTTHTLLAGQHLRKDEEIVGCCHGQNVFLWMPGCMKDLFVEV